MAKHLRSTADGFQKIMIYRRNAFEDREKLAPFGVRHQRCGASIADRSVDSLAFSGCQNSTGRRSRHFLRSCFTKLMPSTLRSGDSNSKIKGCYAAASFFGGKRP